MKGPEITVVKEMTFDSAHYLPCYDGPCSRLHGHTYKIQVGIKGHVSSETGMVCDFVDLKKVIKEVVDLLDHQCLNDIEDSNFPNQKPTAELMLVWLAAKFIDNLANYDPPVRLHFVRLWETPTSYAEIVI